MKFKIVFLGQVSPIIVLIKRVFLFLRCLLYIECLNIIVSLFHQLFMLIEFTDGWDDGAQDCNKHAEELHFHELFILQDSDVHISFEDQQKINKFARLNAKVDDFKDELKVKKNDVKNLEDAVEELSLTDDSEKIPYLVGEVFICQSLEDTLVILIIFTFNSILGIKA